MESSEEKPISNTVCQGRHSVTQSQRNKRELSVSIPVAVPDLPFACFAALDNSSLLLGHVSLVLYYEEADFVTAMVLPPLKCHQLMILYGQFTGIVIFWPLRTLFI